MAEKKWAGNTFGNGFMHRSLIWMLRYSDVRIFYVFTAIFVIPFCLIFSKGARIIFRYFQDRHHCGKWKSLRKTYVNLVLFSQVVIDKFALFAGKRFNIKVENYDLFRRLASQKEGFVILSAHVGCYEMAGYELVSDTKPFNALVFGGEKATVMQNRGRIFTKNNIHMIPVAEDMSHIFEIDAALSKGEIVSLPADRIFGSRKSVDVSLLGGKASLPLGSFLVPVMRGLNVIAVNVMKTGWKTYTAYITKLDYKKEGNQRQQAKQLADGYAKELENILKKYPEQWYNYFEFWK